jgi:hypothetical protein
MDWHLGRSGSFEFIRVSRNSDGFHEHDRLDDITGFSLERNMLADLKVSGSLDYVELPTIGNDLVRIYYIASNDTGTERVALATMFLSTSNYDVVYTSEQGSADLYSVLRILASKKVRGTLTIPAGTVAISYAVALIESLGLPTHADASSATLNTDAVFTAENGDSYLTIVNYLTTFASFSSCYPDAMGTVCLDRYIDPSSKTPTVAFSDREPEADSIQIASIGGTYTQVEVHPETDIPFAAKIAYTYDVFDGPNVVVAVCSGASGTTPITSIAINDDPGSPFSTTSRGYEITLTETVSDVSSQSALDAIATQKLAAQSSNVETIEVQHPYTPEFGMGDCALIDYTKADRKWTMSAVSQQMKSSPLLLCTTKFRRFIQA